MTERNVPSCPPFEELLDGAEGLLQEPAARDLEDHLQGCTACRELTATILDTLEVMKTDAVQRVEVPEDLVESTIELGRTWYRRQETAPIGLVVAHLAHVGSLPVPPGLRGASAGSLDYRYETPSSDMLRVRLQPRFGGLHNLRGGFYPGEGHEEPRLVSVRLRSAGGQIEKEARIEGERDFFLDELPTGTWTMVVRTDREIIHCGDLRTGD